MVKNRLHTSSCTRHSPYKFGLSRKNFFRKEQIKKAYKRQSLARVCVPWLAQNEAAKRNKCQFHRQRSTRCLPCLSPNALPGTARQGRCCRDVFRAVRGCTPGGRV